MKEEEGSILHRRTSLCEGLYMRDSRCITGTERSVQLEGSVQTRSAKRGSQRKQGASTNRVKQEKSLE